MGWEFGGKVKEGSDRVRDWHELPRGRNNSFLQQLTEKDTSLDVSKERKMWHMLDAKELELFKEAMQLLVAEHDLFVTLKEDLKRLKEDITQARGKKEKEDIKHIFRDFSYLANIDKKMIRREQDLEDMWHFLVKRLPPEIANYSENDMQKLQAGANQILEQLYFHLDNIRGEFVMLQASLTPVGRIKEAQIDLHRLNNKIENMELWISYLSKDLCKAQAIVTDLTKVD